jgi:hypothetical protein
MPQGWSSPVASLEPVPGCGGEAAEEVTQPGGDGDESDGAPYAERADLVGRRDEWSQKMKSMTGCAHPIRTSIDQTRCQPARNVPSTRPSV